MSSHPTEHLSAVELREHLEDASDLSADDASCPTPSPSETETREDRRRPHTRVRDRRLVSPSPVMTGNRSENGYCSGMPVQDLAQISLTQPSVDAPGTRLDAQ